MNFNVEKGAIAKVTPSDVLTESIIGSATIIVNGYGGGGFNIDVMTLSTNHTDTYEEALKEAENMLEFVWAKYQSLLN
jgi:hypothetical protein